MAESTKSNRYAVVTTLHRGVFVGEIEGRVRRKKMVLVNCRNVDKWGTTRGWHQLAKSGPTSKTIFSDDVERCELFDITGVFYCTEEARQAWQSV